MMHIGCNLDKMRHYWLYHYHYKIVDIRQTSCVRL